MIENALPEREFRLLVALVAMCDQYMPGTHGADGLSTMSMGAGERAIQALETYGIVNIDPPGQLGRAVWTEAGIALRDDPRH